YNPQAVFEFVQFHTTQERRKQMTKATQGQLPFKGDVSPHGEWVIKPFGPNFDKSFSASTPDKALCDWLDWLDGPIKTWVNDMSRVQNAGNLGGGSGFGPSVDEFLRHVGTLAQDSTSLYSLY